MTDLGERRGFQTDYYEPAEDSYLLASAVAPQLDGHETVLDVGTGSGFVAGRIHEKTGGTVVGVDINPLACRAAASRGIPTVRGDLVTPFRTDAFDVVVCNPPYLPTAPDEIEEDWLGVALSGGPTGRAVVERLFEDVGRVLRSDGTLYLLVSSLMDIDAVERRAAEAGFRTEEVARDESFPFEVLAVLACER